MPKGQEKNLKSDVEVGVGEGEATASTTEAKGMLAEDKACASSPRQHQDKDQGSTGALGKLPCLDKLQNAAPQSSTPLPTGQL